jgi:hypothetical protein
MQNIKKIEILLKHGGGLAVNSLTFNDCTIIEGESYLKVINKLYIQDLMFTETVTVIPFDTITKYQITHN